MTDCYVCLLPAERQGDIELNGDSWVMLLCINGHIVWLRSCELDESLPEAA